MSETSPMNNEAFKGILKTSDHLEDDKPKDIRISGVYGESRIGTGAVIGTYHHEPIYTIGNATPVGWHRTPRNNDTAPGIGEYFAGINRGQVRADTAIEVPPTRRPPRRPLPTELTGHATMREYVLGVDIARDNTPQEQMRLVEEDNVIDTMMGEIDRYHARMGRQPEYISLSRTSYSQYVRTMNNMGRRALGREDNFMGMDIICNPLQTRNVMVLGNPEFELRGNSLYREN